MDHDWDGQYDETNWTVRHLSETQGIPEGTEIDLDIQTVPAGNADRAAYVRALREAGLSGSAYVSEDGGVETIEITIKGATFKTDDIWRWEKAVTEIALAHGYRPDGWGSTRAIDGGNGRMVRQDRKPPHDVSHSVNPIFTFPRQSPHRARGVRPLSG